MQVEKETTIQPRSVEIDKKIEETIDIMATSCADVFLLHDDTLITDEIRQNVLSHFISGIATITGLSPAEAEKIARSKLAAVIGRHHKEDTIFAMVPDVNTGEIAAIMQGYAETSQPDTPSQNGGALVLRVSGVDRPS
jgi:hypothetical protein